MADQLNLDGLSLPELQAYAVNIQNAINVRLTGANGAADAAQSFETNGLKMVRSSLTELFTLKGAVANAIQKKTAEPDGIGIVLGGFDDA